MSYPKYRMGFQEVEYRTNDLSNPEINNIQNELQNIQLKYIPGTNIKYQQKAPIVPIKKKPKDIIEEKFNARSKLYENVDYNKTQNKTITQKVKNIDKISKQTKQPKSTKQLQPEKKIIEPKPKVIQSHTNINNININQNENNPSVKISNKNSIDIPLIDGTTLSLERKNIEMGKTNKIIDKSNKNNEIISKDIKIKGGYEVKLLNAEDTKSNLNKNSNRLEEINNSTSNSINSNYNSNKGEIKKDNDINNSNSDSDSDDYENLLESLREIRKKGINTNNKNINEDKPKIKIEPKINEKETISTATTTISTTTISTTTISTTTISTTTISTTTISTTTKI